jgi:hypothetical protein
MSIDVCHFGPTPDQLMAIIRTQTEIARLGLATTKAKSSKRFSQSLDAVSDLMGNDIHDSPPGPIPSVLRLVNAVSSTRRCRELFQELGQSTNAVHSLDERRPQRLNLGERVVPHSSGVR